ADDLAEEQRLPEQVDGFPVDVIEAKYVPQTALNARLEMATEQRNRRFDKVPLGVSVGSRYTTAGTLGALVLDEQTGEQMILSNWHVLAGRDDVQAGLPIWQPGWIDGGTRDENTIAELSRWMLGPFDAAVARVTGARPVEARTVEGRSVEDIGPPQLGMQVWKSGRSTGLTRGFIDGIKMTVNLSYRNVGTRSLEQVFRVVPRPGEGNLELSIGGDSGAVWVEEGSNKVVGLHFAGEVGNFPEHALAHDITAVIQALDVRFPAQGSRRQPKPRLPKPGGKKQPATDDGLQMLIRYYIDRLFKTMRLE
ncbi:MAG: hypothetical protein R3300_11310, partial [Candidatus Promineifilaceae bacterium]|nr:hypothetical protein [Candidatus Promineifilaceae bacterium]